MTPGFATAATLAVWVMSGPVSTQTPPDVVQRDLKVKQQVSVIDEQGGRYRGRITEISGDSLTIAKGADRTVVPYRSVVRIDAIDDLKNGAKIGAIVGAGIFAVEAWAAAEDGFTLNAAGYAVVTLLYSGAGAAIGAGIDALIGGDRRVYERGGTSSNHVNVAAVVGRHRVGAIVGITW